MGGEWKCDGCGEIQLLSQTNLHTSHPDFSHRVLELTVDILNHDDRTRICRNQIAAADQLFNRALPLQDDPYATFISRPSCPILCSFLTQRIDSVVCAS
nr:unnamed protein product [Spirometra erinaceieuropaei]